MKIFVFLLILIPVFFFSCGKKDVRLDNKESIDILGSYISENIEKDSKVSCILLFADDNRNQTIQSMWVYYTSPSGEKKTIKIATSGKERSILDSIANGKSGVAYDSISLAREKNLIFRFIDTDMNNEGRNLNDYDWTNITSVYYQAEGYCLGISQVPLDAIRTFAVFFEDKPEFDRHYLGLNTVSSPGGIDPNDKYNPAYHFSYSCFDHRGGSNNETYLAGYPISIERKKMGSR